MRVDLPKVGLPGLWLPVEVSLDSLMEVHGARPQLVVAGSTEADRDARICR